ncbi:MAG: hypothetical protein FIA99_19125 [Ruminiclostridium sp.]|nr:hypothetical protein [Ruminiclostridium sp.]
MCKNFEESFSEFVTKRLNEDMGVLVLDKKEFIELNEEIDQYHEKMLIAFTEGNNEAFQECLDKYISLQGCASGIIEEAAYIQGMKDLYKLLKMLEEGEAD